MSHARDMLREMERVHRALAQTRLHLAGLDQADGARDLADRVLHSPLRTLVEQAEESASRVTAHLREATRI